MTGILGLMMREEYRLHVSYSSSRVFFTMPLYVILFTAFFGATFGTFSGTMSLSQIIIMVHLGLFIYGLSVGAFGFLGRTYIERRYGKNNFLVTMPFLVPISFRKVYLAMFVRDLIFYSFLILGPAFVGLSIASIVVHYQFISIVLLFAALFLSFLMGLAFSFLVSVIYTRSRPVFLAVVAGFMALVISNGVFNAFPLSYLLPSVGLQLAVQPFGHDAVMAAAYALVSIAVSALFMLLAATLVRVEFESKSNHYTDRFYTFLYRMRFFGRYSVLLAKEFVDIIRSGLVSKMAFAYVAPLTFLSLSTWYINTGLKIPVGFNAVFYAGMVGFFGVLVYNWLTSIDLQDYYETMPFGVPDLIKAKILAYLLLTFGVSIAFVVGVAFLNGETRLLWLAIPVLLITSLYMVMATAYLTGLRTSSFLFDPSVMSRFAVVAMVPDIIITILSFSVDTSPAYAVTGIGLSLTLLLIATKFFYDRIERRWAGTGFS
ncbi:MAG: hypothetical protein A4E32_00224 [Methanomassiliicoccales archaeon PtaU1.Bin124]|nr:MAG: hypothetical protein A4E32_00224 [Methanomassiliicoccales archaeon PtaU1.Bin124]